MQAKRRVGPPETTDDMDGKMFQEKIRCKDAARMFDGNHNPRQVRVCGALSGRPEAEIGSGLAPALRVRCYRRKRA